MRGRVIVVGGGIAGLSAGFRLRQAGFDVTVFEAGDHVGGRMSTVRQDGFILDTAAGWLGSKYKQLRRMAGDAGAGDLQATSDVFGFVQGGRVHHVRSHSLLDLARTPLISVPAKVSALKILVDIARVGKRLDYADLSRSADFDTESVLTYAQRRKLNRELVENFVDPVVRASLLNTLERMSIIDLLFMLRNYLGAGFMNFTTGIDSLPRTLARHLSVELSARVTSVEATPGGVTVTWDRNGEPEHIDSAASCVIALSGHQMLGIHPQLDDTRREIVGSLLYSRALNVHVALDRPPADPSMYIQVPAGEHPDLTAVGMEHNKAPGRAPAGKGLVTSFWAAEWSDQHWNDDDEKVVAAALPGMDQILPGTSDHVLFARVSRWDPALLLSRAGTYQSLRRFHQACDPAERIQFAGDYFGGNSTNAALCSGERAAQRVQLALGMAAPPG
jgi:protoporphyrinogen/coproporphyrinogen III oxidase